VLTDEPNSSGTDIYYEEGDLFKLSYLLGIIDDDFVVVWRVNCVVPV